MRIKIGKFLYSSIRKNQPKEYSIAYRKWTNYLRKRKLWDEFIIYVDTLYGKRDTYPLPNSYDALYGLTNRLYDAPKIFVGNSYIRINWRRVFIEFIRETTKWYNVMLRFKFLP